MFPRKALAALLVCLFALPWVAAQEKKVEKASTQAPPTEAPTTPRPPLAFGLTQDTPVKIRLSRTMSSKDAKVDEKVDFEVVEDLRIGDTVVIKQGGLAIATVTEAQPKRRMGRSGKLNMNIDYVQLTSGEKVPLKAVKGGSGGSHTAAMTGAMVATGILFFPAAPLFLFMKGKNITIPKGTEVTAYVAADTPLEQARFAPQSAANPEVAQTEATPDANGSLVVIKSDPEGAEITVDGKFVGTTPSTIQLKAGEHEVKVEKAGYKAWQKVITINAGGTVNLGPSLEKLP